MENIKYLFKLLGLKIALCGLKKKKNTYQTGLTVEWISQIEKLVNVEA